MSNRVLATGEELRRYLSDLLGKAVAVSPDASKRAGLVGLAAAYGPEGGEPAVILWVELPAAASLGAALSMVPASAVDAALRTGKLDPTLADNFHEVCNVLTNLLNRPLAPGSKVPTVLLQTVETGPQAQALLNRAGASKIRLDVALNVPGYRAGKASLIYL